jgi:UDP-glucose 4-epimerase
MPGMQNGSAHPPDPSHRAPAAGLRLPARVAVTGGAGFIGSHTVERLVAAGCRVLVIDDLNHSCGAALPGATEVLVADCGSLEGAAALQRFRPQAVLHLAARGGVTALRDPGGHARATVGSSVALVAAACEAGARSLVIASSGGAVYGDRGRLPAAESQPLEPRSPYGASKVTEEVYLACLARLHGVRALALRYGNVYGPRQDGRAESGVVAITCENLLSGRSPVIHGDGLQTRDFVYVADVAAANLAALAATHAGVVNIGTGRQTTVRTVVERLTALHGARLGIDQGPARRGELRSMALATGRAREWLSWSAAVDIDSGLRRTLAGFAAERTPARPGL